MARKRKALNVARVDGWVTRRGNLHKGNHCCGPVTQPLAACNIQKFRLHLMERLRTCIADNMLGAWAREPLHAGVVWLELEWGVRVRLDAIGSAQDGK